LGAKIDVRNKLTNAEKCRRHREKKRAGEREKVTPDEIFRWVAAALRHEPSAEAAQSETVKEEQAPCPQAWGLYLACKNDPVQRRQFWTRYMAFLQAASPDAQAQAEAIADDRRRVFKPIEALYRERPEILVRKQYYDQQQAKEKAERESWGVQSGIAPIVATDQPAVVQVGGHAPEFAQPGSPASVSSPPTD
jgi:hypothetical protein